MARYDVRTAALALDVRYRFLDVVLARHDVPGVAKSAQGVKRSVDDGALLILRIAFDLRSALGAPLDRAIALARRISSEGAVREGDVVVSVDRERARAGIADRVSDALERAVPIRRGRPRTDRVGLG